MRVTVVRESLAFRTSQPGRSPACPRRRRHIRRRVRTAVTPDENSSARAARQTAASPGSTPAPGRLAFAVLTTFVVAAIAFGDAAAHAAAAAQPSFELGLGSGITAPAPACVPVPVPAAECGSVPNVPTAEGR